MIGVHVDLYELVLIDHDDRISHLFKESFQFIGSFFGFSLS
jgi:hypothetical protein